MEEFSIRDLTEILRVSKWSIRKLMRNGLLCGYRRGYFWRFSEEEVERYLSEVVSLPIEPVYTPQQWVLYNNIMCQVVNVWGHSPNWLYEIYSRETGTVHAVAEHLTPNYATKR